MGTFNRVANLKDGIFFQRGVVTTTSHWTRPSYQKVYDFLFNLYVKSMIIKEYDTYLMGGVLFDFNNTWDLDMCIVGGNHTDLKIENDLNFIMNMGLNEYNLLVDVTWYEQRPSNLIYDQMVENEFKPDNIIHKKIGYSKKQINDEFEEKDLRNDPNFILLSDYLVQGNYGTNGRHTEKMINKVQNNPNPITITTFSVNDFLEKGESYFLNNTNR
jgi:hypothetical protein